MVIPYKVQSLLSPGVGVSVREGERYMCTCMGIPYIG